MQIEGNQAMATTLISNPFAAGSKEAFRRYFWLVLGHDVEPTTAARKVAQELGLRVSPHWPCPNLSEFLKEFYALADDTLIGKTSLDKVMPDADPEYRVILKKAMDYYLPF